MNIDKNDTITPEAAASVLGIPHPEDPPPSTQPSVVPSPEEAEAVGVMRVMPPRSPYAKPFVGCICFEPACEQDPACPSDHRLIPGNQYAEATPPSGSVDDQVRRLADQAWADGDFAERVDVERFAARILRIAYVDPARSAGYAAAIADVARWLESFAGTLPDGGDKVLVGRALGHIFQESGKAQKASAS